jgi:hypothetical protein
MGDDPPMLPFGNDVGGEGSLIDQALALIKTAGLSSIVANLLHLNIDLARAPC